MLKVYYRTPSKNAKPILRCFAADIPVSDFNYWETEQAVLAELHNTMEKFLKPVLVLINGGLSTK